MRSRRSLAAAAAALVLAGCSSQEDKNKELLRATNHGSVAEVQAALEAGAEIDGQNLFGHSALHLAVLAEDREKIEFLLRRGADPDNKSKKNGSSPLDEAARLENDDLYPWMQKVVEEVRAN